MSTVAQLEKYATLFLEATKNSRNDYMREYMKNQYHSTRNKIIERLGGKCAKCGKSDSTFHFDHIDKKKKTMRAADLHSVNDEKFESEIKNLQLLCPECHKEKTKEAWDYALPKPKHGSYWRYRKYQCGCPKCVKAYKEKQKEWRENRKVKSKLLEDT